MLAARWMTAVMVGGMLLGCSEGSDKPAPGTGDEDRRHVPLEGQPNFRDLGGYRTAEGRSVKWGMVYRSGDLSKLSDDDVAALTDLGIRTVVDFRSDAEVEWRGVDRLPGGARHVRLAINSGDLGSLLGGALETGDFSQVPDNVLAEANATIIRDATDQLASLFDLLSEPANLPLVFHCTHGKDRAGMASAVLLMALGVPADPVRGDYLLSNVYRHDENESELARLRGTIAERQGVDPADVDMSKIHSVFYLQSPYFDAMLDEIARRYGSFKGYLEDGLRLSPEEIDHLQQQLTE